jgi:hypothetical protein
MNGKSGHAPVDLVTEVATAKTDHVRHADTPAVKQSHHFLGPSTRCGYHTYRSLAHNVCKAQSGTGKGSSPGSRSHYEKVPSGGMILEGDLIFGGDPVAEKKNI